MATYLGTYSETYPPYQGGTGPITPAQPSWSFNAQTRVLSLSHATLGTSELEFSYQNAAYQQYVAGLSVDAAAHPAGDWKGRVKAATGRNPSNVRNSELIAATPTPGAPTTVPVTAANMHYSTRNDTFGGVPVYSPLSVAMFQISGATSFDVSGVTSLLSILNGAGLAASMASLPVFVDGVRVALLQPTQDRVAKSLTVALPDTGTHTIRLLNGAQVSPNDGGYVNASSFLSITAPAGATISALPWVKKDSQVLTNTDSIGVAIGPDNPSLAYVELLRQRYPDPDITCGHSFGSKRVIPGTSSVLVSDAQALFAAATSRRVLDWLGTNNGAGDPNVPQGLGEDADALYTAYSDVEVLIATTLLRANESPTANDTRAQVTALASGRPWVSILDGKPIVTLSDTVDGVHPGNAGNVKIADALSVLFTGSQPSAGIAANPAVNAGAITARTTYAVPDLATAPVLTMFIVASKPDGFEGNYILAAVPDETGSVDTNFGYIGADVADHDFGLIFNAYIDAFLAAPNRNILQGGGRKLLTVEIYPQGSPIANEYTPGAPCNLWVNGVLQAPLIAHGSMLPHDFGGTLTIFGDAVNASGLFWPGTVARALAYPRKLTPSEHQQTNAKILADDPTIT